MHLSNKQYLIILISISILVRILVVFGTGLDWYSTDSYNYIRQAEALLDGGYPYYFPNGYPIIIAFSRLTDSFIHYPIALECLNIFLSTFSVIIIYFISRKIFREDKIAFIAALIFSLYPNQLNYVRFILTEVPATFFLILSFYYFLKEKFIISGILIGIASIIKVTFLPIVITYSVYLFMTRGMNKPTFYFMFFSLLPCLLLSFYGLVISGIFTLGQSSVHNLYLTAGITQIKEINLLEGLKVYINYATKDLGNYFLERIQSLWNLWGFLPSTNDALREELIFRLLIGLRFLLLITGIYGFTKLENKDLKIFLILPVLLLTIIHTFTYSIPRYSFPAEPFLVLLSGFGIQSVLKAKKILTKDQHSF